ncbi:MAG: hypothetical protein HUJ26_00155 [Planctomycetaceae bacterium]|nr:hypothetical protein [Planctomycetaceae bacterium]
MVDPLRKPVSGEPFVPSAKQTGMFIDAYKATLGGRAERPRGRFPELDADVVLVRNDTGADITIPHGVVKIGGPLIAPADRSNVVFERPLVAGELPDEDPDWCVLQQPLADGAIGRAVLSGLTWVRIDVIDEADTHCVATAGETGFLESSTSGPGFILWKESGTGEKWALIRISNEEGAIFRLGKADADIASRTTGTVSVYKGSLGSETDSTNNITGVFNLSDQQADINKWVLLLKVNNGWALLPLECPG